MRSTWPGNTRNGEGCQCPGSLAERMGSWVVRVLRGNYSAFNGYRFTPSAYSEVSCLRCDRRWRTNAKYVDDLPRKPYTDPDYTRDLPEEVS